MVEEISKTVIEKERVNEQRYIKCVHVQNDYIKRQNHQIPDKFLPKIFCNKN